MRARCISRATRTTITTSRPTAIPPSSASWRSTTSGRRRNGTRRGSSRSTNAPARNIFSPSAPITTISTPSIPNTRTGTPSRSARRRTSSAPGPRVARANGLRFGVSNHSSWAARWLQPAYGYDGEGPLAGVRYDAYTLTKADGKGKWWEGLDPQDLYTGNSVKMPDGLTSAQGRARLVYQEHQPRQEQSHAGGGSFCKTGSCAARTGR